MLPVMKRTSKNSTLKDIARIANVSTATVARVIHQNGYVAESTRQKVENALKQADYRINALAQGLRTQRTMTIGHLLTAISPNPFFARVALGAEQEAMKEGYSVLLFNTQGDAEQEYRGVQTLISRRVDAIVFTTALASENVQMAVDNGIVAVQVERPSNAPTPVVRVDNYAGGYTATQHLIDLNHQHIAYVGGIPRDIHTQQGNVEADRYEGYLAALGSGNLRVDESIVVLCDYYSLEDNNHVYEGYKAAQQLLSQGITAIFAASDLLAAGVLQAVYERGMRVPDDISVIGFDDTYGAVLSPALTTVRQPMHTMGREAVRIAVEMLSRDDPTAETNHQVTLTPRLVERSSTGRPGVQ